MKNTLFAIVLICFSGCTLFRKTSKSNAVVAQSSINQLESSQLVLKNAGKETQIFTYWNDSGFYQYQHIKEQVDQARLNNLKAEEKQQAKQTVVTRKTEPVSTWVYVMVFIAFVVCFLIFRKVFMPHS